MAFAIWDLMFGSLAFSEKVEHKFGLKTKFGSKQSIMHLYVEPFKVAFKSLQRSKKLKKLKHGNLIMSVKSMSKHLKFLLAGIILFACLGQNQAAVASELNIYSHRQPFLIKPFLRAFTEKTGIKTNVVYASKAWFNDFWQRVRQALLMLCLRLILVGYVNTLIKIYSLLMRQISCLLPSKPSSEF